MLVREGDARRRSASCAEVLPVAPAAHVFQVPQRREVGVGEDQRLDPLGGEHRRVQRDHPAEAVADQPGPLDRRARPSARAGRRRGRPRCSPSAGRRCSRARGGRRPSPGALGRASAIAWQRNQIDRSPVTPWIRTTRRGPRPPAGSGTSVRSPGAWAWNTVSRALKVGWAKPTNAATNLTWWVSQPAGANRDFCRMNVTSSPIDRSRSVRCPIWP